MTFKRKVYILLFMLFTIHYSLFTICFAQEQNKQESDQQISEFSLAGYGDKGKKAWNIAGKSADIFDNVVKLKDVVANMYGATEDIKLTADKGDFDKSEGKVHVEQNVVITTSTGSKLTTNSLEWDRKKQVVSTDDVVNISRDNMVSVARGAIGQPNLSQVTLQKDVQVQINPKQEEGKNSAKNDKTIITCDGPLEIDYAKNIATFKNNVKVDTKDNLIYSDIMDVYFLPADKNAPPGKDTAKAGGTDVGLMGTKIDKIIARGNVKIVKGQNVSYSQEAIYTAADKKIVLSGKPRLVLYSTEDLSASFGN